MHESCGLVIVKVTVKFPELTIIPWLDQMTLVPDTTCLSTQGYKCMNTMSITYSQTVWGEMCLCVHMRERKKMKIMQMG